MTTQTPYQPTPPQPPDAYPTAPPWAPAAGPTAAEQVGVGQPGWTGVPYTPHGQLMVKYPQAMQDASRPAPPAWWPVLVCTLLLGVLLAIPAFFGAIPAARRAAKAGKSRNPRAPYWIAFGAALVAVALAWGVVISVAVPVVVAVGESFVTDELQDNLVHDGKVQTPKGTTAKSATCEPTSPRASNGLRAYSCVVTLSDGRSATRKVSADRNGNWTVRK
jgi:hypothetical protein